MQDHQTWHLPNYDLKNEQKYLYKIHTLDVYLWTEKDAATFLNHLKTLMPPDRLLIKNAPATQTLPEHRDSMSPVVQQLERTAIVSNFPPRTTSVLSAHSTPGPPTPQSSVASPQTAPAAYNPAAPAPPEPVTYREKTPPPPDDGSSGTGLQAAASYDHLPPQTQYAATPGIYHGSAQTTPHAAYFAGPPQQLQTSFPGPPSGAPAPEVQQPPPHLGSVPPPPSQSPPVQARAPSFGPMAASTIGPASPPPHQASFRQSSFGPPGTHHATTYNPASQYANYPQVSPAFSQQPPTPSAPPAYATHTPIQSPGMPPPPAAPVQLQQQAPIGGYSDFSYSAAQQVAAGQHNQYGAYTGDLHSQAYRPTEAEFSAHTWPPKMQRAQTSQDGTIQSKNSRLQEGVGKMEGKFGKFFNKLDKLY